MLVRILRLAALFPLACYAFGASHTNWDEIRKQVETILHITRPLPALEAKAYGKFSPATGVEADRVSYATANELRVPAIVYHAAGATITKHPALIVVNGHSGDKASWYAYWAGILYARAGAIVLTYDPIGEFERNKERRSETRQHDQLVEPQQDVGRRLAGLMVTDVMQAASYLAHRPDVDPKRIAVLGYSMGSFISSIACAIDTRVHACVLVGGGDLDGPGGQWDTAGAMMCERIPYGALKPLGDRGAVLFALNAKRGPTLVYNGSADTVVDIVHHGPDFFADLQARTRAELGNSKDLFDFAFANGMGHAPYFLTKPVALWLQDRLKFPNWTRKQIEQMPETKVSDWASSHHLTFTEAAFFQQNEGPILALGNDVPAIPRKDLHAIPEAVWDSQQEAYIYETWAQRAQTAARENAP